MALHTRRCLGRVRPEPDKSCRGCCRKARLDASLPAKGKEDQPDDPACKGPGVGRSPGASLPARPDSGRRLTRARRTWSSPNAASLSSRTSCLVDAMPSAGTPGRSVLPPRSLILSNQGRRPRAVMLVLPSARWRGASGVEADRAACNRPSGRSARRRRVVGAARSGKSGACASGEPAVMTGRNGGRRASWTPSLWWSAKPRRSDLPGGQASGRHAGRDPPRAKRLGVPVTPSTHRPQGLGG